MFADLRSLTVLCVNDGGYLNRLRVIIVEQNMLKTKMALSCNHLKMYAKCLFVLKMSSWLSFMAFA